MDEFVPPAFVVPLGIETPEFVLEPLGPEHNDALDASTYGTGELVVAALEAGARRIVIAVGGSATTDGGLGALRAIGSKARLRGIEVTVACDVTTTFVGAASGTTGWRSSSTRATTSAPRSPGA